MSMARDLVYSFAEKLARDAQKYGIPYNCRPIEPGSHDDDYLSGLLNNVEDDRVHAEAEKIRAEVAESTAYRPRAHAAMLEVANEMDPYHVVDGKLVRKSDGRPIIL